MIITTITAKVIARNPSLDDRPGRGSIGDGLARTSDRVFGSFLRLLDTPCGTDPRRSVVVVARESRRCSMARDVAFRLARGAPHGRRTTPVTGKLGELTHRGPPGNQACAELYGVWLSFSLYTCRRFQADLSHKAVDSFFSRPPGRCAIRCSREPRLLPEAHTPMHG